MEALWRALQSRMCESDGPGLGHLQAGGHLPREEGGGTDLREEIRLGAQAELLQLGQGLASTIFGPHPSGIHQLPSHRLEEEPPPGPRFTVMLMDGQLGLTKHLPHIKNPIPKKSHLLSPQWVSGPTCRPS